MVRGSIREYVNDTDGPAFLGKELMRLGVDGISRCATPMSKYVSQVGVTLFPSF